MSRPQDHRLPYMPGIDALRAIAVLAVFFYHVSTGGWMPGGFLGVDVFFVISGYLITALLLGEYRRAGHLNVLRFWLRRARRLLPAVAVMIAVTLVVAAILTPGDISGLRGDALASLSYVNNWHLVLSDQSYFQEFARPSLFRHLWSLSVEEQFYLLWPLVFAAGMTLFGKRRLLIGVLVGAVASTVLMIILFDPSGDAARVFYGSDTRAVGLLLGVALAMVWHPSRLRQITGRGARWILDGAGVLALVMILRFFLDAHDFDPGLYRGGFLMLAFWTAPARGRAGAPRGPARKGARQSAARVAGPAELQLLPVALAGARPHPARHRRADARSAAGHAAARVDARSRGPLVPLRRAAVPPATGLEIGALLAASRSAGARGRRRRDGHHRRLERNRLRRQQGTGAAGGARECQGSKRAIRIECRWRRGRPTARSAGGSGDRRLGHGGRRRRAAPRVR